MILYSFERPFGHGGRVKIVFESEDVEASAILNEERARIEGHLDGVCRRLCQSQAARGYGVRSASGCCGD